MSLLCLLMGCYLVRKEWLIDLAKLRIGMFLKTFLIPKKSEKLQIVNM